MKLEISEFEASQDLELHIKEGKPCGSEEGAEPLKISKGGKIPKIFVTPFLQYNRNFISNLPYENGIPQLTPKQEKEYDLSFKPLEPEKMIIKKHEWTQEKLTIKLNLLKAKDFKAWAEKKFGEDNIDRRMSSSKIIIEILALQERGKR